MKLFRKRIKGNNKGLSLVELVCAVAIFAVAATAIGSAMIVSAQSYSRGTYELDVQEEAQTATNIVGNLIVGAVEATENANVVEIKGEGVTYRITHDTSTGTLNYTEIDSAGVESNGVLAENVTVFDTNLTANPATFKADRNVEVRIEIEKNGRTYEAEYSTTARNGSADAVGAAESAQILVDSTIILEPGQTNCVLPVTVVGSVTNKTFTVAKSNSSDPFSIAAGTNKITLSAGTDAQGTYTFVIKTVETDDTTSLPLDTKTVTVQIRRILSMNGNKTFTGSEGSNGSSYVVTFGYSGTFLDKVYGKDYDTNYVDPRQFEITFSMTGAESGMSWNSYVDETTIVKQTGATPSVSFKLKREMPTGSKIHVTCKSLHANGTNKSGIPYANIYKTVDINKSLFNLNGDLNRGNDGVQITMTPTHWQTLLDTYGNDCRKYITAYEVTYDASGNITSRSEAKYTELMIDSGSVTNIRGSESSRLIPNKDYILRMQFEFWRDGAKVYPTTTTDTSLYMVEYPLNSVSFIYDERVCVNASGANETRYGTASSPYRLKKGDSIQNITFMTYGLDMSKDWRNAVSWKVQKYEGGTWIDTTIAEIGLMGGQSNGKATMKIKSDYTGSYRLLTWMNNIKYRNYANTADVTGNFDFYNVDTGEGVLYIDFY